MEHIKKHLECPVCLEIPTGNIFQCYNSHHICDRCIENCTKCPQCNVAYEIIKQRNLPLEAVRGELEVECKYSKRGCLNVLKIKDLTSHLNFCTFRPIRACKTLGFYKCDIECNANVPSIVSHLKEKHEILQLSLSEVQIGFGEEIYRSFFIRCLEQSRLTDRYYVSKVSSMHLIEIRRDSEYLLLYPLCDRRYLDWICVYLGEFTKPYEAKYHVEFRLSNDKASEKDLQLKWTTPVLQLSDLETIIKSPPSPINITFLKNFPIDKNDNKSNPIVPLVLQYKIVSMNCDC